jgi:hypothetical protein
MDSAIETSGENYNKSADIEQHQQQLQQLQLQGQQPVYPAAGSTATYPYQHAFADNPPQYSPPQYQCEDNASAASPQQLIVIPPQQHIVVINQPGDSWAVGRAYTCHIFWSCFTFWLCGWLLGASAFIMAGKVNKATVFSDSQSCFSLIDRNC